MFFAEPHLKSFYYYRLVKQNHPVVRQLSRKIRKQMEKDKNRSYFPGELF